MSRRLPGENNYKCRPSLASISHPPRGASLKISSKSRPASNDVERPEEDAVRHSFVVQIAFKFSHRNSQSGSEPFFSAHDLKRPFQRTPGWAFHGG